MTSNQSNWSTDRVRNRFSDPDRYLLKGFQVAGRAHIVRTMLPFVGGLTILDVGCGDGSLSLQFLPEAKHLTLLDLSEEMLRRAESKIPAELSGKVTLIHSDLMRFLPSEPADVVICVGVLAHLECLAPAIQKLASLTKPGGRCVMQITDHDTLIGKIQYALSGAKGASIRSGSYPLLRTGNSELQKMASAVGFRCSQRRNHCLMLPGMGRLPRRWLLAYDKCVLNSSILSRCAPSAVLLFEH